MPANLYYTLLDVKKKKKKKSKCNGAQLEVHRGTVFLYIYPNQALPPKKKKQNKNNLDPLELKFGQQRIPGLES